MKIYRFNLHTVAYVAAENSREAQMVAMREAGRIMAEDPNPDIELDDEVETVAEMELMNDGWDDGCIPFGGNGKTIAEILGG